MFNAWCTFHKPHSASHQPLKETHNTLPKSQVKEPGQGCTESSHPAQTHSRLSGTRKLIKELMQKNMVMNSILPSWQALKMMATHFLPSLAATARAWDQILANRIWGEVCWVDSGRNCPPIEPTSSLAGCCQVSLEWLEPWQPFWDHEGTCYWREYRKMERIRVDPLIHHGANFFKGPNSKYFRFCQQHVVSITHCLYFRSFFKRIFFQR